MSVDRPLALVATPAPALQERIRRALEPRVACVVAGTLAEAIAALEEAHPDICFVDTDRETGVGWMIELIRQIDLRCPVVMLAQTPDEDEFLDAVRRGAIGYLPGSVSPERLPVIVDEVLCGEAAVPRSLVRRLLDEVRSPGRRRFEAGGRSVKLTRRETEILDLTLHDLSTHVIARRLGIADVTVRRHRASLYAKLGVRSTDELAQRFAQGTRATAGVQDV